jgi:intracellular multiplication protein IcmT
MWRNTMLPVRVYVVDARVLIPVMVVLVHIRVWTLYVALGGIAVFTALEWLGLTFPAAVRTVRRWIVGSRRAAIPAWKKRRFA